MIINSFSTTTGGGVLFQASALFYTENAKFWPILAILLRICALFGVHIAVFPRVPLIARSWDPGSEEAETQGGNGRAREGERERERGKCCFCLQNDLKEP